MILCEIIFIELLLLPLKNIGMVPYPEPYQNIYQRRRLGALGIEWRPSSINYSSGAYIGLGQEYQLLPLADLDMVFEPIPEFLDATLFELENDVINDDTDSEYDIAEEIYSGDEQGNLGNGSSSDSECSEEDNKAARIHGHGLRRSKRKNLQVEASFILQVSLHPLPSLANGWYSLFLGWVDDFTWEAC